MYAGGAFPRLAGELLNQCDELGIRNQFEVEVLSTVIYRWPTPPAALPRVRKTAER